MKKPFRAILISIGILCIAALGIIGYVFYPKQIMPVGEPCVVLTPEVEKYHNDCLHPCIRQVGNAYIFVQSPYYGWNSKKENPIVYISDNPTMFTNGILLADTPEYGFNSDPNVFVEDSICYVLWREFTTPLCDSLGVGIAVVERHATFNTCSATFGEWSDKRVLIKNDFANGDVTQCPILMKEDGKYRIYAAYYQYTPTRESIGLAVWESGCLQGVDCEFVKCAMGVKMPCTVDKIAEVRVPIGAEHPYRIYAPWGVKHDLWHFDLFTYKDALYMVSVAEKGDNIMLSRIETDDSTIESVETLRMPLINNHASENKVHYRQYYYKPTAMVENDSLYLYYTANTKSDPNLNTMFLSKYPIADLIEKFK